jgi:hypothetical protein
MHPSTHQPTPSATLYKTLLLFMLKLREKGNKMDLWGEAQSQCRACSMYMSLNCAFGFRWVWSTVQSMVFPAIIILVSPPTSHKLYHKLYVGFHNRTQHWTGVSQHTKQVYISVSLASFHQLLGGGWSTHFLFSTADIYLTSQSTFLLGTHMVVQSGFAWQTKP